MSSLRLFYSRSEANPEGSFESLLARSWYMADDPLPHPDLGGRFRWLSLIFSDYNRVLAAVLHAEYCHRHSQIIDDQAALAALKLQYYGLQCSVTPICRLPVEILREIF